MFYRAYGLSKEDNSDIGNMIRAEDDSKVLSKETTNEDFMIPDRSMEVRVETLEKIVQDL